MTEEATPLDGMPRPKTYSSWSATSGSTRAARLAGNAVGFWDEGAALESEQGVSTLFEPSMSEDERESRYRGWQRAVERSRSWAEEGA